MQCERCQTIYSGKMTCNMECKTHVCERCNNHWHYRDEKLVQGHDTWCERATQCNISINCNSAIHFPLCPIVQRVIHIIRPD
jgi:hypothetical protein